MRGTTARASASESSSRPRPGPKTPAAAFSKAARRASTPAVPSRPSGPGMPRDITSTSAASKIGSRSAGTATVAYPAPARIAAVEDIRTAPVRPREPPAIVTWPELNLVDCAPRRGARSRTAGSITPAAAGSGAPGGMPIGATSSSPVAHLPGAT